MAKWILVLAVAVAACGGDDDVPCPPGDVCADPIPDAGDGDGPPGTDAPSACPGPGEPGGPSGGCELIVGDVSECPTVEELCRPEICAGHDCCFCENGQWNTLITDCFEGC